MNEPVLILMIVVVGCLSGLVGTVLSHRRKHQAECAKVLEEAMRNPNLDRGTLESLAYQLTGVRPVRATSLEPARGHSWLLAVGWILLFLGAGLLIGGVKESDGDLSTAGCIVGLIGLGLTSFPFALRELDARRSAQ